MTKTGRIYVGSVTALGALAVGLALFQGAEWIASHVLMFLAIAAGMMVAELFVINLTLKKETMSFSVVEVAMTIGLIMMPGPLFVVACAVGMAGGQMIRRRPAVKAAFNTAMYALAATAASTVYALVGPTTTSSLRTWGAALAGMACFYVINEVLLAAVVAITDRQKMSEVLRLGAPILGAVWAGNVTLGILATHLAVTTPAATIFLAVPFGLSYAAYKAWVASKTESRKMRALYEVGSSLVASPGSKDGIVNFLAATRDMFGAEGAEIVTFESPHKLRVTPADGPPTFVPLPEVSGVDMDGRAQIESYVNSQDWPTYRQAPLISEIGVAGALIVHGHEGPEGPSDFDKEDHALLQMLANQTSVTLRNVALFESVSEERTKLADILDHTSDGIYQVTPDRRIVTWNPAMETITGFSAAEAVGQMCFNILRARDNKGIDMCSRSCPIIGAAAHKCHLEAEAQIMTKDGAVRWISYSHSPILDHQGEMTSDVIVVRDVTRQRAAQELKDDFVATVSHELRTPLTPIKGFLLTLMRREADIDAAQRQTFYSMMFRQTERLERLVGDLLDVSRLEAGTMTVEVLPTEVVSIARQVIDSFESSNPGRKFRFVTTDNAIVCKANPGRLEQVLNNLLQNAVKYSPEEAPIELTVTRGSGDEVSIAVRDEGPGIAADEQEAIFERFYRAGHHLTREQGGTGLGLYIARSLAEAMGGRLSLRSRLGKGSTFSIHLTQDAMESQPANANG